MSEPPEPGMYDILVVLGRGWRWPVALGGLAAAVALGLSLTAPRSWQAETTLLIRPDAATPVLARLLSRAARREARAPEADITVLPPSSAPDVVWRLRAWATDRAEALRAAREIPSSVWREGEERRQAEVAAFAAERARLEAALAPLEALRREASARPVSVDGRLIEVSPDVVIVGALPDRHAEALRAEALRAEALRAEARALKGRVPAPNPMALVDLAEQARQTPRAVGYPAAVAFMAGALAGGAGVLVREWWRRERALRAGA